MAELRQLITADDGTELIAVSIDPADKSKELADRIARDGKGTVGFRLLSDPGHKTIDAYGVFDPAYAGDENEGIPHPAVFIIDRKKKISWVRVEPDYKKRPTVAEIRRELEKLKMQDSKTPPVEE